MSGKTWNEIKAVEAKMMLIKIQLLNQEAAQFVVSSLLLLKEETMTRRGHRAVDDILKVLGVNHER